MENTGIRVVVDTNWYISFLIKKGESRLNTVLLNYEIEIVISSDLINELVSTIQREKLRKYFSGADALLFVDRLQQRAINVNVISAIEDWCSDIKDNYLLILSKDSGADYLITGDRILLSMEKFENTRIVTLPEFIEIINKKEQ